MIYKYDGTYIGGVTFPAILLSGFYRWNEEEWFSLGSAAGKPEYPRDSMLVVFYDNSGKITGLFPRTVYPAGNSNNYTPWGPVSLYAYNNSYKIFSPQSDTVYTITKEKLIPSDVVFRGDNSMPYNKYTEPQSTINKYDLEIITETDDYYLLSKRILTSADLSEYQPGRWGGMVDYDQKMILIEKGIKKVAYINLTDDVFGFLPEQFNKFLFMYFTNNAFTYQIDAIKFLDSLKETGIDPVKLESLTPTPARLSSLTANSNPVLISFTLKENITLK
jgi:hypothetical protein